jgi:hypothetical protein
LKGDPWITIDGAAPLPIYPTERGEVRRNASEDESVGKNVSEWQSSNSESDTALKSVLVAFSKMKERAGAQSKKAKPLSGRAES